MDRRGQANWLGQALRRRRFLLTGWPWRAGLHLATTALVLLVVGSALMLALTPLLAVLDVGGPVPVGVAAAAPLVAGTLVLLAPWTTRLDLARLRLVDHRPVPRITEPDGVRARWRYRLTDRTAWLRVVHLATLVTLGTVTVQAVVIAAGLALGLVMAPLIVTLLDTPMQYGPWDISTPPQAWLAFGLGLIAVPAVGYLVGGVSAGEAALARLLLVDPSVRYQAQLTELTRSRARLVHGFDAERRRIERDLHDVAQQRLTTLTMHLALAELDAAGQLGADHAVTRDVAAAHEHATVLMAELRALIHGIHPKVLTDVGVGAAIDQLAAGMSVPVLLRDELGGRPAAHVESTLYFCVSEALTNAARHSGAGQVTVTLRRRGGRVEAEVHDDGRGGADPAAGTGLAGIADRAAVLDGSVGVSSPPGGPTVLLISLPDHPEVEPRPPEESP